MNNNVFLIYNIKIIQNTARINTILTRCYVFKSNFENNNKIPISVLLKSSLLYLLLEKL